MEALTNKAINQTEEEYGKSWPRSKDTALKEARLEGVAWIHLAEETVQWP
jgi:hypothetical protein